MGALLRGRLIHINVEFQLMEVLSDDNIPEKFTFPNEH